MTSKTNKSEEIYSGCTTK